MDDTASAERSLALVARDESRWIMSVTSPVRFSFAFAQTSVS